MASTIHRHRVEGGAESKAFLKFVDPPPEPDRTLDRVAPTVTIRRRLAENIDLPLPFRLPNGDRKLRMWVIADPQRMTFPAPLIRVREGQTVRAIVESAKGEHTIHWHGIEPSPMNDGVGKHSFEIKGQYAYQWTPRNAGFYFYHCHVNTPLHFEMGLYGGLIVDPPAGPGWVAARNAPGHVVPYDVEGVWMLGAHDPRWHRLAADHAQHPKLDGEDVIDPNDPAGFTTTGILNDWRPTVFTVSGAVAANGSTPVTDPRAAVAARVGQTVLIRLLNASYAVTECRIGAPVEVIAQDGRPLGVPPFGAYSAPFTIPAGTPFQLTTAMRYDLLVKPTATGTIPFQADYLDWRGYGSRGRLRTTITVRA